MGATAIKRPWMSSSGDPDVGRGAHVQQVRRGRRANRHQRGDAGQHVLARIQGAAFDRYRGDIGEGGQDGGLFGHQRVLHGQAPPHEAGRRSGPGDRRPQTSLRIVNGPCLIQIT